MKYLRAGGNRLAPHCGRLVGVYPLTMQRHSHARSPPYSALRTSGWTPTILLPQPGHGRLGTQPLTMQWDSDAGFVVDSALQTFRLRIADKLVVTNEM